MRYFIHAADGQVYGPVDLEAVNQWIVEGRVVPTTLLQPEDSQMRVAASTIPGLQWKAGQSFNAYTPQVLSTAKYELTGSWVCFAVSILVCCLPLGVHVSLGVGGIILAVMAYRKGRPIALLWLILNVVLIGLYAWMRSAGSGFNPQQFQEQIRQLSGR